MSEFQVNSADLIGLLKEAGILVAVGGVASTADFTGYTTDSRKLADGELFLAYRGVQFDAHALLPKLLSETSRCGFILDDPQVWEAVKTKAPWACLVTDTREAWAWLASYRYGHPQRQLKLIGVTGTNGKTSTVWFVRQILRAMGQACLTLGTLGIYLGDSFYPASHTTPDPDDTFRYLAAAVRAGIRYAAMEVSSHALVQKRMRPLRFDAVAFTSFSRDHLDFHASMEEYFAAKWQLISAYRKPGAKAFLATNLRAHVAGLELPADVLWYGADAEAVTADVQAEILGMRLDATQMSLQMGAQRWTGSLAFAGDFAVENFAAAWAMVKALSGHSLEPERWSELAPVPGRFEPVVEAFAHGFAVIVDYAHTPDALEKTLIKLKAMTQGKLWAVFGCGGDRDKGKRPLMGALAERYADVLVLTSDNPRTEDPQAILADIQAGLKHPERAYIQVDRREAMALALAQASAGDAVLIAGKGHEDYQIIGTVKHDFDDHKVAASLLLQRKTR